ncbi:hypothetical protein A2363_02495 [Candidatus Gottesmanbacteria bacterium RIFOXYB1_FULL_47_11]|uniref:Uncharacterized protein n=1 Tax=Candidatus Gottesmanbacteria bacterium RIFOXYB1_FULL_47_11 TaxID=1798401 RepID=A0A1F6BEE6_9BACT|nr:MAG: hypothetical protein A2363_02495 [Candidatus Gottesmanbacteria bacterium RIFOXYB1_FULL_47_11]
MNKSTTIIIIIVALFVFVGGAAMYSKSKITVPVAIEEITPASDDAVTSQDTSDNALDQDFATIDAKLKAADQDATNIDTGLNDKQGDLSEQ